MMMMMILIMMMLMSGDGDEPMKNLTTAAGTIRLQWPV